MSCDNCGKHMACECPECEDKKNKKRASSVEKYLYGTTWRYSYVCHSLRKDWSDKDFDQFVKEFNPDYHDRAVFEDFFINFSDGEVSLNEYKIFGKNHQLLKVKVSIFEIIKKYSLKIVDMKKEKEWVSRTIERHDHDLKNAKEHLEFLENFSKENPDLVSE